MMTTKHFNCQKKHSPLHIEYMSAQIIHFVIEQKVCIKNKVANVVSLICLLVHILTGEVVRIENANINTTSS